LNLSRIFSIQATIVLAVIMLLACLFGVSKPPQLLFGGLFLAVPVVLIAIASRFDRATCHKLTVVACTVGWILVGWCGVLFAWANTYGS
jgi:hypothetical protein